MRKIIHIDMDYFFAQVEERDNPDLKGKPVAIGGEFGGRGVLSTSNYEARKFGVKAAMPTRQALKLCPQLILVPSNFHKYRDASTAIFEVFKGFTKKIQSISLDEAFLDVTDCSKFNNDAVEIAKEIKRRIYGKTKLTASAGVSYNKLLAKIGSDLNKPNGIAVIRPHLVEQNISHFSVRKIWGVGKVTDLKMQEYGIRTFGDLQKYKKLDLVNLFGDFGAALYEYCRGIDNSIVEGNGERKSLSVEHTFLTDILCQEDLIIKLETCYNEMCERLEKISNRKVKCILVKIKYADFSTTTVEAKTDLTFENFKELFLRRFLLTEKAIRLLGTGVKFFSTQVKGQVEMQLA